MRSDINASFQTVLYPTLHFMKLETCFKVHIYLIFWIIIMHFQDAIFTLGQVEIYQLTNKTTNYACSTFMEDTSLKCLKHLYLQILMQFYLILLREAYTITFKLAIRNQNPQSAFLTETLENYLHNEIGTSLIMFKDFWNCNANSFIYQLSFKLFCYQKLSLRVFTLE